ncbi:MAG TPA: redox-regulated ATPase YchF [Anaerovoracaceae bacterium]|nr:redox-regulated ATPase YchF [Anaerovoracaceae bacterium]
MKLGIVGLPNVGKSTLFNAITKAGAEAANYPFCTIEPNIGVVTVPDERIKVLQEMYKSKKAVYTTIEFYDIAGLVKGASRGEGLGNKFLSHIREVAAIVHVVRCFDDPDIVHVDGKISPISDIETINLELIFSDLEIIERRLTKAKRDLKADKKIKREIDILERIESALEDGATARSLKFEPDEIDFVKSINLLSYKPVIYAANISEDMISMGCENEYVMQIKEYADKENSEVIVLSAKLESEIAQLMEEEKDEFFKDIGITESGLERLIKASYSLLNLISFLTAGPTEAHAWTIAKGTKASKAAGKIHSDFEKGFIRAETIAYDKLVSCGNFNTAKEKGFVRSEGKDYIVKDGDVILFLFNV